MRAVRRHATTTGFLLSVALVVAACGGGSEPEVPADPEPSDSADEETADEETADDEPSDEEADGSTDGEDASGGESRTFAFSAYGPAESDETQIIRDFATEVEELTDGAIVIEVYDSGSLYDQATAQTALARGDLEMTISNAAWVGDQVPAVTILSAPYVIQSVAHREAVLASDFGHELFETVAAETGIRPLQSLYLGTRNLNLKAEAGRIEVPADLAGLNVRMPDADSWIKMGQALGFNPTPIAINELYTALQTGTVVGQDNPVVGTIDFAFHEVTDQYILTQHLVDDTWYAISEDVWQSLSAEHQEALSTAARNAADRQAELYLQKEADGLEFLESEGLDVYEPDVDAFREHVLSVYLDDADVVAAWPEGAVDIIQGLVPAES